MKSILDFLKSDTFGFLLKLLAGIAAAGFGIFGVGIETRDKDGKLTRYGRIALIGIICAGVLAVLAVATSTYELVTGQQKAAQDRLKSEQLMLSVQRGLYPLRGMRFRAQIKIDDSFIGVREYKESLKTRIRQNRFCMNESVSLRLKSFRF